MVREAGGLEDLDGKFFGTMQKGNDEPARAAILGTPDLAQ